LEYVLDHTLDDDVIVGRKLGVIVISDRLQDDVLF
jgi:hypothetical protein